MDLTFEPLDPDGITAGVDFVFLALPHTDSMHVTPRVTRQNVPVVDLSGDFRLNHAKVYTEWYKIDHVAPEEMEKGMYGLPELNREKIQGARFVANPGCYPTAALLGVAPLLKDSLIHPEGIIIDAKSGVTGAGKSPKPHLHFPEANESFTAYKVAEHQHTPEIEQEMTRLAGRKMEVTFTTHLLPMNRGVLCTIYAALDQNVTTEQLLDHYKDYYRGETFVRILPAGTYPNTKNVRGTNICDIGLKVDSRTRRVIVISAIDNLGKGASGQAVQNMNLMLGLSETTGLKLPAMTP
ncbi:MAG: N-acetyl-gamma-glutamyl-phosphate reductase, partial [bacterium]|nr:N-acetyl-gamma-glutamyl-phosphate reductase [bacterium]